MTTVRYTFDVTRPHTHLIHVEMAVPAAGLATLDLVMPAWLPGAYKTFDNARNLRNFEARTPDGRPLRFERMNWQTWRVHDAAEGVVVTYQVFANKPEIHQGQLDAHHAFLNPGTLGLYGVWTSGINYYYEASEWTVGAQYEYKLTDKWAVTPGFQYFGNVIADADDDGVADGGGYSNRDAWAAGVTVDYKVVEDLKAKLSLQYRDEDDGDDGIFGFMRLQRDF